MDIEWSDQEARHYLLNMAAASLSLTTMLARIMADSGTVDPADLADLDHALTGHLDLPQDNPNYAVQEMLRTHLEGAYGESLAQVLQSARRNFRK